MKNQEIIDQLVKLELNCPNDFELGGVIREFIINNFKSKFKKNKIRNRR